MNISIPEVKIFDLYIHSDPRGHFFELFREDTYREALGIKEHFVQDNFSFSKKNVLRGLHYQVDRPQGKLVTVLSGAIFDVVVDIRKDSSTYGQWIGEELSAENGRQLWVPPGLAHGFLVLSDTASVLYKCTDYYHPQSERTLMWDDPTVNVKWPLEGRPIMSAKDLEGGYLT